MALRKSFSTLCAKNEATRSFIPPTVLCHCNQTLASADMSPLTRGRLLMVFTMPIALDHLGWKLYLINGSWNTLMIAAVAIWWVETKGRTLEELDVLFEGEKHSSAPNLEDVYRRRRTSDGNVERNGGAAK